MEQVYVAVESAEFRNGRNDKEQRIDNDGDMYYFCICRADNFMYNSRKGGGHDVEHDEVELPP